MAWRDKNKRNVIFLLSLRKISFVLFTQASHPRRPRGRWWGQSLNRREKMARKKVSSQPSMNFNMLELVYSRQLCKLSSSSRGCITVSNSPNPCRLYIRRCQTRKTFLGDCLNNFRSSSNKFPKIFKSLIFHISLLRLGKVYLIWQGGGGDEDI